VAKHVSLLERLHWLGHASFRLDGPPTIYFDPWRLKGEQPQADIILVSHEHDDHCSPGDIERVRGPNTVILVGGKGARKLEGDVRAVHPGEKVKVGDVLIETVPAYNIGKPYHPKEAGDVGYVVTVGGQTIYHAGDTDLIPEMKEIECDVALLPVGGTYTMNAEEAAQAAAEIRPRVAVPMHWGAGVAGQRSDGERFRELYDGEVAIL
jgi:L-ascorbate metabolism protein UlaG (beta-lactamase superfamily)